jgi:uncharacterized protein YkwD
VRVVVLLLLALAADRGALACPPEIALPARWPKASVRVEDEVLAVINGYRGRGVECRATGARRPPVGPLKSNDKLRRAARGHSTYMAEFRAFDHTVAGCPFSTWIKAAGYRWGSIGENIALRRGRALTALEVVQEWLASRDGHCEALMDPKWRSVGVGYASVGNRHLWTVDFGDR